MKQFSKVFVVGLMSLLIVSCGKDRTREQQVSAMIDKVESPFFIASMNVQSLMDKSEVMEEGTLPFTYYQVISFFLAVELTGIDYDTPAQFIVGEGESFLPNFYGIFKVDKEDLFIELLEVEANATIEEKDGMKYAIKDKEGYCIVWNEEFAVISNIPMDLAAMLSGKGGKEGQKMVDKNIEMIKAAEDGEPNEDYVAFLERDADIAMMYEGEGFYKYMKNMSMGEAAEIEKMKDVYEGMSYQMFMNFEKGKMTLDMEADLDEELKEKLKFMGKEGVSKDLFAYGKTSNPLMTGTYKVSIDGFLDYFKDMSEEDYTKMVEDMEEEGLAIEDIKGALTGEIVYMIEEVVMQEEVYDFGYEEPITIKNEKAIFGIVIGVGDKSLIEKTMQEAMMASQNEIATTDPDGYEFEEAPKMEVYENGMIKIGEAFIWLGDDVMFSSNDSAWTSMIAAGQGKTVQDPNGVLSEKPFGFFVDFARLASMESIDDDEAAEMLAMMSSFYGSANLDGGTFTMELANDSENSLKVLTSAFGAMLAKFEEESNIEMLEELEEGVEETQDGFEKLEDIEINEEDIEKAVEEALKEIEQ